MTNVEIKMPKKGRSTNDETFGIWISSFVISSAF